MSCNKYYPLALQHIRYISYALSEWNEFPGYMNSVRGFYGLPMITRRIPCKCYGPGLGRCLRTKKRIQMYTLNKNSQIHVQKLRTIRYILYIFELF